MSARLLAPAGTPLQASGGEVSAGSASQVKRVGIAPSWAKAEEVRVRLMAALPWWVAWAGRAATASALAGRRAARSSAGAVAWSSDFIVAVLPARFYAREACRSRGIVFTPQVSYPGDFPAAPPKNLINQPQMQGRY